MWTIAVGMGFMQSDYFGLQVALSEQAGMKRLERVYSVFG